jgi:predicted CopG family antitoxin
MATKNISLSEDAYKALKNLKESEESFSDVIRRLSSHYANIDKFAGAFPELADVQGELKQERKQFKTREVDEL